MRVYRIQRSLELFTKKLDNIENYRHRHHDREAIGIFVDPSVYSFKYLDFTDFLSMHQQTLASYNCQHDHERHPLSLVLGELFKPPGTGTGSKISLSPNLPQE